MNNMSMDMVYTQHTRELEEYLKGKLPDMPAHTAQEIAAHIGNKTMILVSDMMRAYDRHVTLSASRRARQRAMEGAKDDSE